MIYCLMVSGVLLDDSTRALLFDTAQKMLLKKKQYHEIKRKSCEGYVKTSWMHTGIGTTYGILFNSFLETDRGNVQVDYIVRPTDIKGCDLVWLDNLPEPTFSLN